MVDVPYGTHSQPNFKNYSACLKGTTDVMPTLMGKSMQICNDVII